MTEPMECAYHPGVETYLRCGKCGQPICPRCMVQTPVGARCRECAQRRRLPTYDVSPSQYVVAATVGAATALASGVLWAILPLRGYFSLIMAAALGYGISELVGLVVNRRRGPGLQTIAALSTILSFLVSRLFPILLSQVTLGVLAPPQMIFSLLYRILLAALMDPFAWIAVGIGVFVAVSRLR